MRDTLVEDALQLALRKESSTARRSRLTVVRGAIEGPPTVENRDHPPPPMTFFMPEGSQSIIYGRLSPIPASPVGGC